MKIIKPGKTLGGFWSADFTCSGRGNGGNGCGAELEVSEDDLFQTHSSSMGESAHYTTFLCPGCGVQTDVSDTYGYRHPNLPSNARNFPSVSMAQQNEAKRLLRAGSYTPPHKVSSGG